MRNNTVPIFIPHIGCRHACTFCNQHAISGTAHPPTAQDVRNILAAAHKTLAAKSATAEIAFFGGSFTAIDADYRRALLHIAGDFLDGVTFNAIRVSTRPDAISPAILDELRRSGVATIELGAQSMDNAVLAGCARGHTAEDTIAATRLIRGQGFSLGLQMMTGLPGDTAAGALVTAAKLIDLHPDFVRVYPTLVLRGSPLEQQYISGSYHPQTPEEAVTLCAELLELFTAHGIRVIRLGLHNDRSLQANIVAGPHHPALRELAESHILLHRALDAIRIARTPPGPIKIAVAYGAVSKMTGHRRGNIKALAERGYSPTVITDSTLGYLQVRIMDS